MKYRTRNKGQFGAVGVAIITAWSTAAAAQWTDAPADGDTAPASGEAPASDAAATTDEAASASNESTSEKEPPKIDVTTPEPEPPVARSYHVHDGFYLRLNIGIGGHAITYNDDITASGGSVAFDALVGGSPNPGFAIGGALIGDYSPNLALEGTTADLEANVQTGIIGVFIDGFPDPKGGFHIGGALGLANIQTDPSAGDVRNDTGFGGAAWIGYDAWVGDEWSVGGLVRFATAVGRSKEGDQDLDSRSSALTLLFTALYH